MAVTTTPEKLVLGLCFRMQCSWLFGGCYPGPAIRTGRIQPGTGNIQKDGNAAQVNYKIIIII